MTMIRLNRNYSVGDMTYGAGQVIDVPEWIAKETLSSGDATIPSKSQISQSVKTEEVEKPAEVGTEEIPRRGPGRPKTKRF